MNNKIALGILTAVIGLVFCAAFLIYAAMNPWNYNGMTGLFGSLHGTHTIVPFTLCNGVMIAGWVIAFSEAYGRKN